MRRSVLIFSLTVVIWAGIAGCGSNAPAAPALTAPPATAVASAASTPAAAAAQPSPTRALPAVSTSAPAAQPSPTAAPAPVVTVAPGPAGRHITVTLASFSFSPSTLSARAGQPIRLNLENSDSLEHEFAIDNSDVTVNVPPHTTRPVDFEFTMPGTYTFACNLNVEGDHRSMGMVGTIVVEPAP